MKHQLCEPILDNGLRTTNFFNGRLLAAEDLQTLQDADRQHRAALGQAIGSGVLAGLEVAIETNGADGADAVVSVSPGLAVTGSGQTLQLTTGVDLVLARQEPMPSQDGQFDDCASAGLNLLPTGVGAYVLLIAPASGFAGRVPMSGLGASGAITGCGSKYQIEGAQFRLAKLSVPDLPNVSLDTASLVTSLMGRTGATVLQATDAQDLSMLRNVLAHVCFGTELLSILPADPPGPSAGQAVFAQYGVADTLLATGVSTLDSVPLALVYWTQRGIRFVDLWAVRRRPGTTLPQALDAVLFGERRVREAEAVWFQFRDQMEQLRASGTNLSTVVADQYFRYLPPAGLVPVAIAGSTPGFDTSGFLGAHSSASAMLIEGNQLRALFHDALYFEPIDLARADARIQRYLIWENIVAAAAGHTAQHWLVFASAALSYRGTARYGLSSWGESRFVADL
jgi:hypothetical protein